MSTLNEIKNALNKAMELVLEYEKEQATELVEEPVKFSFEKYQIGEFAVNCRTKKDDEMFLSYLHDKGCKWNSGDSLLNYNLWQLHGENICYFLEGRNLLAGCTTYCRRHSIPIILFNPQDLD